MARGSVAMTIAAAIAMLEFVAVTTKSIPNIWPSIRRFMPPSVIAIAPAIHAMVSAPVTRVATYRPSHVVGVEGVAGYGEGPQQDDGDAHREGELGEVEQDLDRRQPDRVGDAGADQGSREEVPPLANSSPKTNGRSARENEWALRRNCRWTTQASATAHAAAIAHHGRWGSERGASPLTDVTKSTAASAARTSPYTDTATAGDTSAGRDRVVL